MTPSRAGVRASVEAWTLGRMCSSSSRALRGRVTPAQAGLDGVRRRAPRARPAARGGGAARGCQHRVLHPYGARRLERCLGERAVRPGPRARTRRCRDRTPPGSRPRGIRTAARAPRQTRPARVTAGRAVDRRDGRCSRRRTQPPGRHRGVQCSRARAVPPPLPLRPSATQPRPVSVPRPPVAELLRGLGEERAGGRLGDAAARRAGPQRPRPDGPRRRTRHPQRSVPHLVGCPHRQNPRQRHEADQPPRRRAAHCPLRDPHASVDSGYPDRHVPDRARQSIRGCARHAPQLGCSLRPPKRWMAPTPQTEENRT